ncbi:hypothetical protein CEE45_01555 [Candidatus Heimdallarchaeota archaeon B3_Heim]|nr:MAG: hypothetical protein CEE45_01555 [Candidatus Heimdallarchaeota archaeon B3_Heim]
MFESFKEKVLSVPRGAMLVPKRLYKTLITSKGILTTERGKVNIHKKEAFFTREEILKMESRAQRFHERIQSDQVGLPITFEEFERLERRSEWDELRTKKKSGTRVTLLATGSEVKRGLKRSGVIPGSRRKSLKPPPTQLKLTD